MENTHHERRARATVKERTAKARADGPKELMMKRLAKEKERKTPSKRMKEAASGKMTWIAHGPSVTLRKKRMMYE